MNQLSNARLPGESFEEYKERRKKAKAAEKKYFRQGRTVFPARVFVKEDEKTGERLYHSQSARRVD